MVRKSFGQSPRRKVFVRVQEVDGPRVLSTQSFSVWGHTAEDVAEVIAASLDAQFGEEEEEAEEEKKPARKLLIKKRVGHGR